MSKMNYNLTYASGTPINLNKNLDSLLLISFPNLLDNLKYSGLFEQLTYLGEEIKYEINLPIEKMPFKKKASDIYKLYSSDNYILLVYNNIEHNNHMEITKLYHPYKLIYDNIKDKKIKTIFIKELDSIINVYEFIFNEPDNLNSIELSNHLTYKFI